MKGIIREEAESGVFSQSSFREIPIPTGDSGKEEQLTGNKNAMQSRQAGNYTRVQGNTCGISKEFL